MMPLLTSEERRADALDWLTRAANSETLVLPRRARELVAYIDELKAENARLRTQCDASPPAPAPGEPAPSELLDDDSGPVTPR